MIRRLREWPRLSAAVALLAILLVLVGVVIAPSGSGGSDNTATAAKTTPAKPSAQAARAALVRTQAATITRLRVALAGERAQVDTLRQRLKRERALVRLHLKATHIKRQHANRR